MPPFHVLVTGPESSGKSTLAAQLAEQLGGRLVPEYARAYLATHGLAYERDDLTKILAGQLAAEKEALNSAAKVVVSDTGPEVLFIWSQEKYGAVAGAILEAVAGMHYDLILLCYPEYAWEPDPQREHPALADRLRLWEAYRRLLVSTALPLCDLSPRSRADGASQLQQALRYVELHLG